MTGDTRAIVTALYVYPVKSCRGIELDQSELVATGLKYDRLFVIGRPGAEDGGRTARFVSQRQEPMLSQLVPELDTANDVLRLRSKRHPELTPLTLPLSVPADRSADTQVRIWADIVPAIDLGGEAWLATALDGLVSYPMHVYRMPTTFERVVDPERAFLTSNFDSIVGFADAFPLLLTSMQSLAELNRRMVAQSSASHQVPMSRFRPNVVVDALNPGSVEQHQQHQRRSLEPFEEDAWKRIRIGSTATFVVAKPCSRCRITTTDQDTGQVDTAYREPLRTLETFRKHPLGTLFGQNLAIENARQSGQRLQVGDVVQVLAWQREESSLWWWQRLYRRFWGCA
ncbi:hypothetical protein CCYA_CCYA01G0085 [Cyanidiococcus yangmingshanensis]|nr:hypothetical protein CCYA_CCYA01G0085 [Cyanidiococcus yangmingshanensis]